MLRTPATSKGAALVASGVLHLAAFAAAGHAALGGDAAAGAALETPVEVLLEPQDETSPAGTAGTEGPESPAPTPVFPPARAPVAPHTPAHDLAFAAPGLASASTSTSASAPAPASTSALASELTPTPRFMMVLGGARVGGGAAAPTDARDGDLRAEASDVLPEERATTPAHLVSGALPRYPPQARADGIEANVSLEIIVDSAGRVRRARVVRAADPSRRGGESDVARRRFDEAALAAVADYRFAPARLDGRAVTVRMRWRVEFRLQ